AEFSRRFCEAKIPLKRSLFFWFVFFGRAKKMNKVSIRPLNMRFLACTSILRQHFDRLSVTAQYRQAQCDSSK
ncbi:MAG: hypothetical protein CMC14_14825, partial [Flavobacteriaceae bacterium]|nr:hypothetical protein [Flavobacteriaceae bacterium]